MLEIVAGIISVVVAAAIGIKIKEYRSPVIYEVLYLPVTFKIENNSVSEYTPTASGANSEIAVYRVSIVNHGRRGAAHVNLHSESGVEIFSVKKETKNVNPNSVKVTTDDNIIRIDIDYLPPKEEIVVIFVTKAWPPITKFSGIGSSYSLHSIHYLHGYNKALSVMRFLFVFTIIGGLLGFAVASKQEIERLHDRVARLQIQK